MKQVNPKENGASHSQLSATLPQRLPVTVNATQWSADLLPFDVRSLVAFGGSFTLNDGTASISSGTSVPGSSYASTLRSYSLFVDDVFDITWTCKFPTPTGTQFIGIGISSSGSTSLLGYYPGQVYPSFINLVNPSFQTLNFTVVTGATSNGNLTLTIGGIPFVIPLTIGDAAFNAFQIYYYFSVNNPNIWYPDLTGTTITLLSAFPGPDVTFSFANSIGVTATFTQVVSGASFTIDVVPSSSWLSASSSDLVFWRPTQWNTYRLRFYGYDNLQYDLFVWNRTIREWVLAHRYTESAQQDPPYTQSARISWVVFNRNVLPQSIAPVLQMRGITMSKNTPLYSVLGRSTVIQTVRSLTNGVKTAIIAASFRRTNPTTYQYAIIPHVIQNITTCITAGSQECLFEIWNDLSLFGTNAASYPVLTTSNTDPTVSTYNSTLMTTVTTTNSKLLYSFVVGAGQNFSQIFTDLLPTFQDNDLLVITATAGGNLTINTTVTIRELLN